MAERHRDEEEVDLGNVNVVRHQPVGNKKDLSIFEMNYILGFLLHQNKIIRAFIVFLLSQIYDTKNLRVLDIKFETVNKETKKTLPACEP